MKTGGLLIYVKCIFKNKYSRWVTLIGVFLYVLFEMERAMSEPSETFFGLLLFVFTDIYQSVTAILIFILGAWFLPKDSYRMYQRALSSLIRYKNPVESNTYCGKVGAEMALSDYLKKYPEYRDAVENNRKHRQKNPKSMEDLLMFFNQNMPENNQDHL